MQRKSGVIISLFFMLLYSFIQAGCIDFTEWRLVPCPDSPESPRDPHFEGCYQRTVENPTRDSPDMFLRIEQNEDCPSILTGEGWGLIAGYVFTGGVVEFGRAELLIEGEGCSINGEFLYYTEEWTAEAQRIESGLLSITLRQVRTRPPWDEESTFSDWESVPEEISLPYVLEKIECPESEGD